MNKIFKRYYLLLLFVGLLAVSCSSTKSIVIEVPTKAKNELPERIQSLLIVNRTIDDEYTDLPTDSLQNMFFEQHFNLDTLIHDKQAADTMLRALSDLLYESGRYDVVIPEERFLPHEENAFFSEPLSWDEVSQLCLDFNTDAVLSVDMYSTRVITSYDRETYFNPYENSFYTAAEAHMSIIYEALLKIYDPSVEEVVTREFMRDTLVWENYDETATALFSHFTSVKQGLMEASIAMALDFSEKISTNWHREGRTIFAKGDKKLEEAGTFVDNGDWDSATKLWQELAEESSSKSLISKAQFNLAVAAELTGDIDGAISWGLKSYDNMFHQSTYDYLEYLNRRKKQLEKQ